jgi:hypothetical protein
VVNRRILRTDLSSMPMGVSTVPVEDYPWDFYLDLPPAPARL